MRIPAALPHYCFVPIPDAGLNKPLDRAFKAVVDEAPEIFLRLLGILPPGAQFRLAPLRAETAPPVVLPDFVASLEIDSAEPVVLHIEFVAAYRAGIPSVMARYGASLAWQYNRKVLSILILLRGQGVPRHIPKVGEFVVGDTVARHPFRTVRLWKIDPAPILQGGDWRWLPWSVLMKSSDEDVRRVAAVLARQGDDESVGRFLTLGGVRYDRKWLEQKLAAGGRNMGLREVLLESSSIFREAREEGWEKGRAEGREEGRVSDARRSLRIALEEKFPGLDAAPEIDAISTTDALESLLKTVVRSTNRTAVKRALASAARQK